MRRTRTREAIGDIRTAILLGRMVLRMRAGYAPWHSRSRAGLHRLKQSRLAPGRR